MKNPRTAVIWLSALMYHAALCLAMFQIYRLLKGLTTSLPMTILIVIACGYSMYYSVKTILLVARLIHRGR